MPPHPRMKPQGHSANLCACPHLRQYQRSFKLSESFKKQTGMKNCLLRFGPECLWWRLATSPGLRRGAGTHGGLWLEPSVTSNRGTLAAIGGQALPYLHSRRIPALVLPSYPAVPAGQGGEGRLFGLFLLLGAGGWGGGERTHSRGDWRREKKRHG